MVSNDRVSFGNIPVNFLKLFIFKNNERTKEKLSKKR